MSKVKHGDVFYVDNPATGDRITLVADENVGEFRAAIAPGRHAGKVPWVANMHRELTERAEAAERECEALRAVVADVSRVARLDSRLGLDSRISDKGKIELILMTVDAYNVRPK